MPEIAELTSPSKDSRMFVVTRRVGSVLRASISEGRRQRGMCPSIDSISGTTPTAACTAIAATAAPGITVEPTIPDVGATPMPRAAWAARTSSGAVGSPSRRRFPNTMKAIIIVTPPVVATAVGATAARIAITPWAARRSCRRRDPSRPIRRRRRRARPSRCRRCHRSRRSRRRRCRRRCPRTRRGSRRR